MGQVIQDEMPQIQNMVAAKDVFQDNVNEDGFVEIQLSEPQEEVIKCQKSDSKNNTLKRKNSKKKKEMLEKKFDNEVDQALYEIQMMEQETKHKSNTVDKK